MAFDLKELGTKFEELFKGHQDAKEFILEYTEYIHRIDDIIDEPDKRNDPNFILETFARASICFSMPFYRQHADKLVLIDLLANVTYKDSVAWEKQQGWQRTHADVLRHVGYNMFFAVLFICRGYKAVADISAQFREYSHLKHINDLYEQISQTTPHNSSNNHNPIRPSARL